MPVRPLVIASTRTSRRSSRWICEAIASGTSASTCSAEGSSISMSGLPGTAFQLSDLQISVTNSAGVSKDLDLFTSNASFSETQTLRSLRHHYNRRLLLRIGAEAMKNGLL